jgi:GTP pyrophosphokinase
MNTPIDKKYALEIEKAINFLVKNINKSGHNDKPVILHSLQIAFYLLKNGYGENIVIGAILHDILEDTDINKNELADAFGNYTASLVQAVSYDQSIKDWEARYKEMFTRVKSHGKDALILKCADILFNSFYIQKVKEREFRIKLVDKIKDFLKLSKGMIMHEKVWIELETQYQIERKRLEK